MVSNMTTLIGLCFSTFLILRLFVFIYKQNKQTNLKKSFIYVLICLLICCIGLISQITFGTIFSIPTSKLVYFDYFVYIGTCFLPVAFIMMALTFVNPKFKINKLCFWLCILPVICLIVLWTNDFHHLFYINYSTNLMNGTYGIFFYITSAYTYCLLIIGLFYLIKYSIKNAKFFWIQSLLICLGALIPISVNILGLLGILDLSIYITPICFSITVLLFALSIFKFGFLKIAPIAIQTIVNKISDAYLVINDDYIITDFNKTLLTFFSLSDINIRGTSLSDLIDKKANLHIKKDLLIKAIEKSKMNNVNITYEKHFEAIKKYFHIEITAIKENNIFLGTLILFKDITQHMLDMQELKDNQEVLIEKERLASLGQMIGGIAHNLKTPIMSISGAMEGLSDLINEYELSVENPHVTIEDHKAIANDMRTWISKTRTHLSYMSDIITAVKGQAVNFADNTFNGFTITELVKYVDILMKHELKNALITMTTNVNLPEDTKLSGNINSLVQVINNIISNAIQAYNGKPDQQIIFNLNKEGSNLVMRIQDFAGGLPKEVQDKLFKEMVTTKGKNGTGLGLFMSYSNIKGHFNGNLDFKVNER